MNANNANLESARFKFEFPKSEIRNKFQSPKIQNSRPQSTSNRIHRRFLGFEFGICFGFRVSDFGFLCPTGGVQQKSYGTWSVGGEGRVRGQLRHAPMLVTLHAP